jgi:hypothetical protein
VSKKTIRDQDHKWLFHAIRLPGILESDEAASLLGVASHAVPILIAARHLKPLGKPSEKASKKFSSDYIEELSHNQKWQDQAMRLLEAHWANQNGMRRKPSPQALAKAA